MRPRALLLALLAVLHLVVQPLAAHAYCAVIGTRAEESCCCARVETTGTASCCASTEPDTTGEQRRGDCDCNSLEDPLPATPAAHVERAIPALALAAFETAPSIRSAARCRGTWTPSAAPPPPRVPARILLQTFRL